MLDNNRYFWRQNFRFLYKEYLSERELFIQMFLSLRHNELKYKSFLTDHARYEKAYQRSLLKTAPKPASIAPQGTNQFQKLRDVIEQWIV